MMRFATWHSFWHSMLPCNFRLNEVIAALGYHVPHVVRLIAKEQMRWIEALAVVARVADVFAILNLPAKG